MADADTLIQNVLQYNPATELTADSDKWCRTEFLANDHKQNFHDYGMHVTVECFRPI